MSGRPAMIVETLVVGLVQTNCYVIADQESGDAAVIDPGGDVGQIVRTVQGLGARLKTEPRVTHVVNTHAHFDHSMDNGKLIERLARLQHETPKLAAHVQARSLLAAGGGARWFGFPSEPGPQPDLLLREGDVLSVGGRSFRIMYTPGHSPGSISLYSADEGCVFVGDVLFNYGIGRSDLPGGDQGVLLSSIRDRLLMLPDDTTVYPGHGPVTTIGHERTHNPFL
jgi:glyoxylase-like metal-dependent hydrolase (beta-lactamase superfamily II)